VGCNLRLFQKDFAEACASISSGPLDDSLAFFALCDEAEGADFAAARAQRLIDQGVSPDHNETGPSGASAHSGSPQYQCPRLTAAAITRSGVRAEHKANLPDLGGDGRQGRLFFLICSYVAKNSLTPQCSSEDHLQRRPPTRSARLAACRMLWQQAKIISLKDAHGVLPEFRMTFL